MGRCTCSSPTPTQSRAKQDRWGIDSPGDPAPARASHPSWRGAPSLRRVFLYLAGAAFAFAVIEVATSNLFQRDIREETARGGGVRTGRRALSENVVDADIVLDLTDTDFIDSRGFGALSVIAAELVAQGRSLTIENVDSSVRKVVEMAGLSETLGLGSTRQEPTP